MDIFLNEQGVPFTTPRNPNVLYRLLLALSVVVVASWALALQKKEWSEHKKMHILLGAFLLVVTFLFMRFNIQYFQGQARYLFPAISVFGVGVAISLLNLTRARWQVALAIIGLILGGLNVYALMRLPGEFQKRTSSVTMRDQTVSGEPHVLLSNGRARPRV